MLILGIFMTLKVIPLAQTENNTFSFTHDSSAWSPVVTIDPGSNPSHLFRPGNIVYPQPKGQASLMPLPK